MQFNEIIGQEKVKEQLIQADKDNRISHAQLFLGPEGSGNLGLALSFATYVLCENKQENDSCGQCPSCQKMAKFQHPDVHFSFPFFSKTTGGSTADEFLDSWRSALLSNPYLDLHEWRDILQVENKQLGISTKEASNLIKKLSLKAYEGGYKIVILWMPEYMRPQTSNKLLKILEEPPEKTLFLLVANSHENIISTILSRTQLLKISKVPDEAIRTYLIGKSIEEDQINYIVQYSNGNIHKVNQLLQKESVTNEHFDEFGEWMRRCYTKDLAYLMKWSDRLHKKGREHIKEFLEYSSNMVRQCLIGNYTDGKLMRLTYDELDFANKFARFINDRNAIQISDELEKAHLDIGRNVYGKLVLFDLSLQITKLLKL